jgi:probable F420-dependent oxidoreductase
VVDPRPALDDARRIEALGLGTVWIGERFDTKDLPSLAGAICQVTSRVRIAAGITPFGMRHPMVLASMGQTLQALSNGRFRFGFGRSAAWRWRMYGIPAPTLASMADTARILRRLWAGEAVTYHGPAGDFPELRMAQRPSVAPPPIFLAAVGPKTLALAGRHFDGAVLHPFLTPEAVRRSCAVVRESADRAARDPASVVCVATVATAPDRGVADKAHAIRARAAGYFQVGGLGDALVRANGWDGADLARYRAHPVLAGLAGRPADKALSRDELIAVSETLPASWIESASAAGTAAECAARLHAYLAAGADELLLHGTTAGHLGSMVDAFVAGEQHG